jgi:hypothetical protein
MSTKNKVKGLMKQTKGLMGLGTMGMTGHTIFSGSTYGGAIDMPCEGRQSLSSIRGGLNLSSVGGLASSGMHLTKILSKDKKGKNCRVVKNILGK